MIEYLPRDKTRSEEAVKKLRYLATATGKIAMATQIERNAALIASAMALLHGGEWRVQIDHQAGLVMIVRN